MKRGTVQVQQQFLISPEIPKEAATTKVKSFGSSDFE